MQRGRKAVVEALADCKNRAALVPFVVAGDPDYDRSLAMLRLLGEVADVIEVGIPYSDPLADGPTIQAGAARALSAGMNLEKAMQLIAQFRAESDVPVIAFTYANPVYRTGIRRFLEMCKNAGADGVIIPDLPHEESATLRAELDQHDMAYVPLVALTSGARAEQIAKTATGFVYCVSTLGVTGERARFAAELPTFVNQVKNFSKVPVAVGFGVSNPEQVAELSTYADGVIVGSAFVKYGGLLATTPTEAQEEVWNSLRSFAMQLAGATSKGE